MVSVAQYHRNHHHHGHYHHRGLIRPSGTHGGGTCAHSPCRVEREAAGEAPDQGQEVVGVVGVVPGRARAEEEGGSAPEPVAEAVGFGQEREAVEVVLGLGQVVEEGEPARAVVAAVGRAQEVVEEDSDREREAAAAAELGRAVRARAEEEEAPGRESVAAAAVLDPG